MMMMTMMMMMMMMILIYDLGYGCPPPKRHRVVLSQGFIYKVQLIKTPTPVKVMSFKLLDDFLLKMPSRSKRAFEDLRKQVDMNTDSTFCGRIQTDHQMNISLMPSVRRGQLRVTKQLDSDDIVSQTKAVEEELKTSPYLDLVQQWRCLL